MTVQKTCMVLIGVPGSGKSTWIQQNSRLLETYSVMSTDNIIESIAASKSLTYNDVFADSIFDADKKMWQDIRENSNLGFSMIIDRTNMSVKSRKRLFDILKPKGYELVAIVFDTPDEKEWTRRLESRPGKTIPKNVLTSMTNNFQPPSVEEGFSLILKAPEYK